MYQSDIYETPYMKTLPLGGHVKIKDRHHVLKMKIEKVVKEFKVVIRPDK